MFICGDCHLVHEVPKLPGSRSRECYDALAVEVGRLRNALETIGVVCETAHDGSVILKIRGIVKRSLSS